MTVDSRRSQFILAGAVMFIVFGTMLAMIGLQWTHLFEGERKQCVKAVVIAYKSGSTVRSARTYARFSVELPNGTNVGVDDTGAIPESFRGPTPLVREKGETTGMVTYRFPQPSECAPL